MKQLSLILVIAAALAGCQSMPSWFGGSPEPVEQAPEPSTPMHVVDVKQAKMPKGMQHDKALQRYTQQQIPHVDKFGALHGVPSAYQRPSNLYSGAPLTKHVGHYVQSMAQDLLSNMEYLTDKTPVGVTHFALLDTDLQETNLLGLQIAESFMHELHKIRIPVIDYKSTDYIRVTDAGDFFLSRDFLELENRAPIDYVLTGTMTKHQGGYLVNARIIGLKSKAVVSSAQTLVPFFVVDALLPSEGERTDGIGLVQG